MSVHGESRAVEADGATATPVETAAPLITSLTRSHFPALDGLRGLAILLVVVYHFGLLHPDAHSKNPALLLEATQLGWMGVDLFFILSGFLITSILWETKCGPRYFKNFLGRRLCLILGGLGHVTPPGSILPGEPPPGFSSGRMGVWIDSQMRIAPAYFLVAAFRTHDSSQRRKTQR